MVAAKAKPLFEEEAKKRLSLNNSSKANLPESAKSSGNLPQVPSAGRVAQICARVRATLKSHFARPRAKTFPGFAFKPRGAFRGIRVSPEARRLHRRAETASKHRYNGSVRDIICETGPREGLEPRPLLIRAPGLRRLGCPYILTTSRLALTFLFLS
jgi:hypothetical protein